MRLSPEDVGLFYKLYPALLLFVNSRCQVEDVATVDQLMYLSADKRWAIREAFVENNNLIDEFVEINPEGFTSEELEIVSCWKKFVKGRFYLFRQLKKHAIFLTVEEESKAYGVLAISDLFSEIIPFMPIFVNTLLLPFKGKIIYDGLISSQNIYFGGSIKRSINETYNEAKAKYGVITSLTDDVKSKKNTSDQNLLKLYLRSERNQERYWDEIQRLIRKSEENKITYYQELGKYFAKLLGRRLRELGIESGWFGILENTIIGSGKTKKEAIINIENIVSKKRMKYVYLFQLRVKKSP